MIPERVAALRSKYATRYGLTSKCRKDITRRTLEQLEACKSESARRLILGVSRRTTEPQSTSR